MNRPLRPSHSSAMMTLRAALFLVGPFFGSLPLFAQGNVLPTMPDPPALAPPPAMQPLPFVGRPDHEGERRRRPLEVAAVMDGTADTPSVQLHQRSLPVLRLPGDSRFGETLTWLGFWLEFRFHPSKAGTTVRAVLVEGATCFFNGALPAAETRGTIGAAGIWRVPINFDPAERDAQLVVNCEGVETRLFLKRWPSRKR